MTKVIIKSGICGFIATIVAEGTDSKKVKVKIDTPCPLVTAMGKALPEEIEMAEVFKKHVESVVYKLAGEKHMHTACPVPMAVIKAVEAEFHLALPRDATMVFDTVAMGLAVVPK